MKWVSDCVEMLLRAEAKRATKYVSENQVISVQRKSYNNKIDKRDKTIDLVMKIGRPNFAERKFIKMCKKAGEPFPVRNIIIKEFKK